MAVVTKSEAEEEEAAICNGDDEKVDVATGRRCCCCTPTVEAVAVRPSCTTEGPAKDETEPAESARVLRERMNFIFSC